ncbi:HAMP domain-containing sensor histidine kinase [Flavivirga abyssicola]|uniref:sensor histidine kinase n=1 Tax=Flavivirga abyssicola TaxID=3063533 RepID=UPI0026E0B5EF|nr:HAMP domain-containing sensor histidine kinase [Flavivirga sp. MEBiC07777]WVK12376.1 HAMP domain-containing sensor histidine kinase [Flavivirga sp. MEBiC07777]
MKLVTKTNTYYLIFFIFLFPLMIAADYYLIQYVVITEVDEILQHESERIRFELKEKGTLPSSNYVFNTTTVKEEQPVLNVFKDTLIYEAYTDKLIPYRTYEFMASADSQRIKISLRHVLLEMNELIVWLFATTSLIILVLVVGLYVINQGIYKWAWKPFFENLSKLKNYEITKKNPVGLEASNISEFEELNKIVVTLMDQVKKDFQNLREFNENISHEIQTPLAIIRNKMILLLESQNLNKKELQWVQAVYQEANKLSKIGKSLTLISRIENQEFIRLDNVDIRTIVDNIINNMEEMIKFKNLEIKVELNPVKIKCDLILANILFTNLIKNAVQHNQEGGYITILLNEEKFEIINSGEVSKIATEQLFRRFQRGNTATDSLGLGLAINQKICELYGFRLDYYRHGGTHTFSLFF